MADYRAHLWISGLVTFENLSPEVWEAIRALLEGRGVIGAEPVAAETIPAEQEPPKPEQEPPKPEQEEAKPEPVRSRKTAEGLPENIGDVIKRLRHIYHLSAQEFANKIGFSKSAVEFWEAGRYALPKGAAASIMQEFELTTLELTEEDYAEIKRRRDEILEEDARRRESQRAMRMAQTEAEG